MHHDPNNNVKFSVRKKISEVRQQSRRISTTEMVAVDDPLKSPEAFDGRYVLRHMRSSYREYADSLDYHSSSDLKILLATIIARVPKRRNPSFTWGALFETLFHMRWLVQSVVEGLQHTDRFSLAENIRWELNELQDITESAQWRHKNITSE